MNLDNFFNPKSVAVIGASSDKNKVGYALMANLLSRGQTSGGDKWWTSKRSDLLDVDSLSTENSQVLEVRPLKPEPRGLTSITTTAIFPVSISESEIMGLKTYKSIVDIQEPIDLAVIAVRADVVPSIIAECGEKKIGNVIVISAGFKEASEAGKKLEMEIAEVARKYGIALLGPNCLGTIDLNNDFNCSFSAVNSAGQSKDELREWKGGITFLSQSGALGTSVIDLAIKEGVRLSKFISLGNEASLTEIEFLEYLAKDSETKAILVYLEKLTDGKKFIELATEITKTKPIVVLKAGRSKRGQTAVASHTGSLAPEDSIFTAACKQAGIITVESIREFFNMAKLFQLGIVKPIRNLIVLTNGGGPSVVATDLIDLSRSLSLIELSEATKELLRKVLPPMAAVNNPIDIIGDALAIRYEETLRILCTNDGVDAIFMILTPQMMTEVEATANLVIKYRNQKAIIPVFIGGPMIEPALRCFKQNGLVNFGFPKDAVEALDNLEIGPEKKIGFDKMIESNKIKNNTVADSAVGVKNRQNILQMMDFCLMMKLIDGVGLKMPGILIRKKSELIGAISKIGSGVYTMKAISAQIVHKTDAGAVCLNLRSVEEAQNAWDTMMLKIQENVPEAKLEGVFVQRMVCGREVIIGMKRDNSFGPTILFGLGGIFTEVLKDVSMRVAPVTKEMARQMIMEIKGVDVLTGVRGEKSVDIDALVDIIVKMSELSIEHPEIREIDLNPVMVTESGANIVDARMMKNS